MALERHNKNENLNIIVIHWDNVWINDVTQNAARFIIMTYNDDNVYEL